MKPYRVLDLAGESGVFCTKILAALGADVIKVEPPGGDPGRRIAPFYHDDPDPEKSLHWLAYNLNKRSITLNIESKKGQEIFKRLVSATDFLVECFRPGYMEELGLGYESLSALNPGIIYVSITPFGSGGPYGEFKGSALVCAAMSGHTYLVGDPDRPPVELSVPAAYVQNGVETAAAMMVAFYHRQRTGKGQHIDVSVQESYAAQLLPLSAMWKANKIFPRRGAAGPRLEGRPPNIGIFECKDGYVMCHTGYSGGRAAMREWLAGEGMAGDLYDKAWDGFFSGLPATMEQKAYIEKLFAAFAINKTRHELMQQAQARGVQAASEQDIPDIMKDPQLKEREYFVSVPHPEIGESITFQGAPYKCDALPWEYRRRAPHIGEHNGEVYQEELGLTSQEVSALRNEGVV